MSGQAAAICGEGWPMKVGEKLVCQRERGHAGLHQVRGVSWNRVTGVHALAAGVQAARPGVLAELERLRRVEDAAREFVAVFQKPVSDLKSWGEDVARTLDVLSRTLEVAPGSESPLATAEPPEVLRAVPSR